MTKDNNEENPSPIPRPNSFLVGPSSHLRAPPSLLSSALPPSLLAETKGTSQSSSVLAANGPVAMRPRRLWTIQDTALKRIPVGYPPLNPYCTTYVGDSSPSVVAVRISECLRKRSIAVEYDDETVTATCLTVDRCLFHVQLFKGNPDLFSHGVVVECMRISGSVVSFHAACRAILQAALGQSTGDDTKRRLHHCNGREYQHLPDRLMNPKATLEMNKRRKLDPEISAAQAFEEAKELVGKDRLDTKVLGMERLVDLTSPSMCGRDICMYVSRQLLEVEPEWLISRVLLDEEVEGGLSTFGSALLDSNITHSTIGSEITSDEGRHASMIRAFALRVLSNALSNLAESKKLGKILQATEDAPHALIERALLDSLIEDLKGVNRPPSVVQAGTNTLASVHEAALAIRILRILGEHSEKVREVLNSDVVLERLEAARTTGRAMHVVLQQEAERTYDKLTLDIRSC